MKISSLLTKDWHYDDAPHHWKGVLDPTGLVTWKDIEYCLNNPNQFDIKFINRFVNQFIDYPKHERAWDPNPQPEVGQLMDIFAEGHTCIIEKFEYINQSKRDILFDLEKGIRSGLSYSGSGTILELQTKAKFISQSASGLSESRTHIDKKAI